MGAHRARRAGVSVGRTALATVLLLLAPACGTDPAPAGPEDAVQGLLEAYDAGDCDGVRQVALTPDAVDCGTVGELTGTLAADGLDPASAEYASTEPVGGSAVVTVRWGTGDPDEDHEVQQVDGDWKVDLDAEP